MHIFCMMQIRRRRTRCFDTCAVANSTFYKPFDIYLLVRVWHVIGKEGKIDRLVLIIFALSHISFHSTVFNFPYSFSLSGIVDFIVPS